jgi:hypothetical protein
MKNKIVGVFVGMLFIGVAFAPGITASVNITDHNNNLVEITVEVDNREHKIILTPDQAEELENLIERTKTRLDAAGTREETSRIFDETVISLYELGVLPDDRSIEKIQQLVSGRSQFNEVCRIFDNQYINKLDIFDNKTNLLCLIAGNVEDTFFRGRPIFLFMLMDSIYKNFQGQVPYPFGVVFTYLAALIAHFFADGYPGTYQKIKSKVPISLLDVISIGEYWDDDEQFYPTNGVVHTVGLNGLKSWDGAIYGHFPGRFTFPGGPFFLCPGVIGFTGIKINLEYNDHFFFGFALLVKIGNEPPNWYP